MQHTGYGEDAYCSESKELLKSKVANPDANVYFVSGGTQTNLLVTSGLLQVHEAVISAKTGHIFAYETGAIEATGHRIITVDTNDGKISPLDIECVLRDYSVRPHMVKPRLVYISNSTEVGTIYSRKELSELSIYCREHNLLLFMDGAHLGHVLTANDSDITLPDISQLTDVFYIGGTKNGALLGEAVIFNNPRLAPDFDYVMKQKGALLAKGRLLGIQFLELFKDDLYFKLASHANRMATKISDAVKEYGYSVMVDSPTNQVFPILPKTVVDALRQKYSFLIWKNIDAEHAVIRLITSWATDEEIVDEFIGELKEMVQAKN